MTTMSDASKKARENATVGDIVLVKGRPRPYHAKIEVDSWGRLTVRPLPGQDITPRARAIWRRAVLEVMAP
jgi:hypothetical protein